MTTMDDHCLQQIIQRYEKANFTVNRRLNAMIRDLMPEGLTVDQFGTIRYLRGAGVCTSSELADIFCVGKSSITAIISRLFDKQLIERIPDEKDRRVTLLRLTEEGERVSDLVEKEIEKMIACFMNHFSLEECMAFINTFEKLAEVMTEQAKETDRS